MRHPLPRNDKMPQDWYLAWYAEQELLGHDLSQDSPQGLRYEAQAAWKEHCAYMYDLAVLKEDLRIDEERYFRRNDEDWRGKLSGQRGRV